MLIKNYQNTAERVAEILLEIKAVTISPKKPYKFVSGIIAPIYTDNRLLMGYPLKRKEITIYMANFIKEKGLDPDIIAGTSTAGIPPASWLAELLNLPMVYVRSEKKDHGKGKQIEGVFSKGANVLLIEDLISTGKSSLGAVDAIREDGGKIDTCLAFLNYDLKDAQKKYQEKKIGLYTLSSLETIVNVAERLRMIDKKDKQTIFDWQNDPWGWAKKFKLDEGGARTVEY